MNTRQGAFRLFRFAGIDVYLHWFWFLVAVYEIQTRARAYSSPVWNVLEYLALFLIVLMHEYGHALACKSVGGKADQIMLWPLGGVAYVSPPPRAGANLWSIAAGPLVNVALVPVFLGIGYLCRALGVYQAVPDVHILLRAVATINVGLLIFNLLPVYPLDGGQILRSLLWFVFGRARSLMIAAVLGILGCVALVALAVSRMDTWLIFICLFIGINCWNGLKQARALSQLAKLPRRQEFACPSCKTSPPVGAAWRCSACTAPFDTFANGGQCPACGTKFAETMCIDCGKRSAMDEWKHGVYVISSSAVPTASLRN
jgi:Zn-dependent protease